MLQYICDILQTQHVFSSMVVNWNLFNESEILSNYNRDVNNKENYRIGYSKRLLRREEVC